MTEHICPRCKTPLKTVTVQVPVYETVVGFGSNSHSTEQIISHYETREEVAECVRCTGSY